MAGLPSSKTAEELRREIVELQRQQREITERLRDPRGLRKGGPLGGNARNIGPNAARSLGRNLPQRGFTRRGEAFDAEYQPPMKKRLLSAVVKVEEEEGSIEVEKEKDRPEEEQPQKDTDADEEADADRRPTLQRKFDADETRPYPESQADPRARKTDDSHPRLIGGRPRGIRPRDRGFLVRVGVPASEHEQEAQPTEPLPRVLPKIDDPKIAKRNRRMFGALLGTLEKFRQEDKKLSGSEAFMRRSDSLKRAEQRAQEESERLRQQEREQLAERRRSDLILRAKLAAEADEKQLELLFIQWTEHHSHLCFSLRTNAEPAIYFMPAKPSEETDKLLQDSQKELEEWKIKCREEFNEYQKKLAEEHLANMELEIERWQSGPRARTNDVSNIQAEAENGREEGDDSFKGHGLRGVAVRQESGEEDDEGQTVAMDDEADEDGTNAIVGEGEEVLTITEGLE